uniref:Uncharacterized protein n=1 Tax=Amphimedon queenslandica TaxID=400682 RepID=A0A1X7UZ67_AMPQE
MRSSKKSGGPIYVRLRRDDDDDLEDLNFRYKPRPKDGTQSESSEEDPTPWYMNGSNEVPRTAWEEDEEEAPPPPPPRNDQLGILPPDNDDKAPPPLPPRNDQMKATPSHEAPPMRDEVTEDRVRPPRDETGEEEEEEEEEEFEEDTGHFLGVGRGDETGELPPLPPVRPPRDLTSPPLPVKMRKKEPEEERERVAMGSSNDEEALIRELTELERLVDDKATPKQLTSEELRIKYVNFNGRHKLFKLLFKWKADPAIKLSEGYTALSLSMTPEISALIYNCMYKLPDDSESELGTQEFDSILRLILTQLLHKR